MVSDELLPEERARVKIDKQLKDAGWDVVSRSGYVPINSQAVREALMKGNKESDYLFFVDNKAIAVLEAKKESDSLGDEVAEQAEHYATHPQDWYGLWYTKLVPLVYLANGDKIYFKNLRHPESEYEEISAMHSPKEMLQMLNLTSEFGALPRIEKDGLRDCQYWAEVNLESSLKAGKKKALAVLATGSGKTYLACLASYRFLTYTYLNYDSAKKRVLFLVDRNNLARQTENEFSKFTRTENNMALSSIYNVKRLRKNEDINEEIVISTIQKLFAVMKGEELIDTNEDSEDEESVSKNEYVYTEPVDIGKDVTIPPDYFQFIVVDECHRSIYGKWRSVLEYFKDAKVLGLTATPTEEAYAFFNKNTVEKYTYEESVVDGVNVPARIYRIQTEKTENGGMIEKGSTVIDISKDSNNSSEYVVSESQEYSSTELDRSVINRSQIETVLSAYRDAIYTDLYPEREELWGYIPKTLIFAKSDKHASEIVSAVERVFAEKFTDGKVPKRFVQKITYSAGDSNALIREFRTEKEFRIAVTVTLVATGTDVKPLEVVLFMTDVHSDVLYTQMKGRGCRTISRDNLKEVTPNADGKECYYIVDAVGVTESEKTIPKASTGDNSGKKFLLLKDLLEHLAHGEVSDENLVLLSNYCATISNKYESDDLFRRHLDEFIEQFKFSPRELANNIITAIEEDKNKLGWEEKRLPPYKDVSDDNRERKELISCLINNIAARKKLLELKAGYYAVTDDSDEIIYAGFSQEDAKSFIENFENCLEEHKDSIGALRIIYNSEDKTITHSMLTDLQEKLVNINKEFRPWHIWKHYHARNPDSVDDLNNTKHNVNALTNLIQIARYAYHKTGTLSTLFGPFSQRFNLYCGQDQRTLTDEQQRVMLSIAEHIVEDGSFTSTELNFFNTELWRRGITAFYNKPAILDEQIQIVSKFILKEVTA